MTGSDTKSNAILGHLVANSVFTPRQLSIILKRLQGPGRAHNISSGAYYRQVRQCRDKVAGVIYSVLLLQSTGVLQPETLSALARLADELGVISRSEASDVIDDARLTDVISVMDMLVKRMSKL